MPKSGFAASSQGKVAAVAIINLLRGQEPAPPSLVNTCYSLIGPKYGVSVAGVYQLSPTGIVEIPGSGGRLRPMPATNSWNRRRFSPKAGTPISARISGDKPLDSCGVPAVNHQAPLPLTHKATPDCRKR